MRASHGRVAVTVCRRMKERFRDGIEDPGCRLLRVGNKNEEILVTDDLPVVVVVVVEAWRLELTQR